MPESDTISRNTHIMLLAIVGNVVAVYGFNIGLARMLSPVSYGDYKVAESFFNLASIGVLMGGGPAALRFLPGHIAVNNSKAIWEYIQFYLTVIVFASVLLALVTLGGMAFFYRPASSAEIHPMIFALLVIPFVSLAALVGSVLQSAQRMDLAFLPWWVGFPALKLGYVALFFVIVGSISAKSAVLMALLATLTILFYQSAKASQLQLLVIGRGSAIIERIKWLKVSVPMMFLVALQTAFNQVDIYMLEIIGQEKEVGHFAVASTVTLVLFAIQLAVMGVFEPLMAAAIKAGEDSVRMLNARCFRRLLIFSLPIFVLIMVFAEALLSVFGDRYTDSIEALRLLAPGYLISTALASSYAWLQYAGYERKAAVVMLAGVLANLALDIVLIPEYGIAGAAAGTTLAFAGIYTAFCIMMRKYLGIFPWSRAVRALDGNEIHQ
tara:strand:- start:22123 stop:23436 length:1314 start_codon:yes stop_codon:yes gene_type:complete